MKCARFTGWAYGVCHSGVTKARVRKNIYLGCCGPCDSVRGRPLFIRDEVPMTAWNSHGC